MSALTITLCICTLVPQFVLSTDVLKFNRNIDLPIQLKTKSFGSTLLKANLSDINSFNDYADSILQDLKEYSITYGLDPVELEDINEGFEYKIVLITYKGELTLTNGWMQGLSTIYRTDDVIVTLSDKNFNIAVPVSLEFLLIDYKYTAKLMGLGPKGNIDARITGIDFTLNLGLNSETKDFTLNNVEIKNSGNVKLKFTGNALTDWVVNIFSGVLKRIFNTLITTVLEGNFSEIFEYVLQLINNSQ